MKRQIDHEIMRKVALKYSIIKLRYKLSFTAFEKQETIGELFFRRILRSYHDLVKQKDVPSKITLKEANRQYDECIRGTIGSTLKMISFKHVGIDYRNKMMKLPDEEEIEYTAKHRKIKQIFAHSKCFDIFKNIRINDRSLYGEQSKERFVRYKSKLCELVEMLNKLNLVIQLKAVRDEVYIRIIIKRIEISKEIFSMNIELGLETFIPKILAQHSMPISFRFYDPIMNLVVSRCSEEMRQILCIKNRYFLESVLDQLPYSKFL